MDLLIRARLDIRLMMYRIWAILIRWGILSVTKIAGSLSWRWSRYRLSQISQRILKYTSLSLSPFPRTMAERLDQLMLFRSKETISPIRHPVENRNSNKAFSIGQEHASRKCSISLSVRNLGIRFPGLGSFIFAAGFLGI
jgi:hypothetical protein